jgi:hypothetical protein
MLISVRKPDRPIGELIDMVIDAVVATVLAKSGRQARAAASRSQRADCGNFGSKPKPTRPANREHCFDRIRLQAGVFGSLVPRELPCPLQLVNSDSQIWVACTYVVRAHLRRDGY